MHHFVTWVVLPALAIMFACAAGILILFIAAIAEMYQMDGSVHCWVRLRRHARDAGRPGKHGLMMFYKCTECGWSLPPEFIVQSTEESE